MSVVQNLTDTTYTHYHVSLNPDFGIGKLLGSNSFNLTGILSTTAIAPTYATLTTLTLTTVKPSSYIHITFTCAMRHLAGGGLVRSMNVRVRLDGALLTNGAGFTINGVSAAIHSGTIETRRLVSAGLHTVVIEWAKLSGSGTVTIDPGAGGAVLPYLSHARLFLQEEDLNISDTGLGNLHLSNYHVYKDAFQLSSGSLISTESVVLASDVSTTSTPTTAWDTLFSESFTTTLALSILHITFSAVWINTGNPGVNVATNFRLVLNGTPIVGGTTDNDLPDRPNSTSCEWRNLVAAGTHTVAIQWGRFGATQTITIRASSEPDRYHGILIMQEEAA